MPVLGSRRLNQHGVPVQHTTWLEGATWLSRKTKMQSLIFYGWTNRSAGPGQPRKTGNWYGWPAKDIKPATLTDDAGRAVRIRAPVNGPGGAHHAHQPALYRPTFRRAAGRGDRHLGAENCR